jgi:hypothetical protein
MSTLRVRRREIARGDQTTITREASFAHACAA